MPDNVTRIEGWTFSGCSSLISIIIPNSVTTIGYAAFKSCSSLTSIIIPNSVTNIGSSAFEYCHSLTSVTIPNSVTSIGQFAFQYCNSLTSITIPNSVTSIYSYAFYRCSGLTSVTIGNSVTSIGSEAFRECSSLTSVTIGNSVTSIGSEAFMYCSSLTSVTIPNSVTSIGSEAFRGCSCLTSVTISTNVTSIGSEAFRGCSNLTSITIPNSVAGIEGFAFYQCSSLTSVTIGNGVRGIDQAAFAKCPEITDVYCYAESVPSTSSDAFEDSYQEYITLHVPAASVATYRTTEPWSEFGTIVAIDGETPETPKCSAPTISYENGTLSFSCDTEGVEFISEISDADVKKYYEANISLTATYNISVYATKNGYENSETVTATLCWIDADPKTEGIENEVVQIKAVPVLIKNTGGLLSVSGISDGQTVSIYNTSGQQMGSASSTNGCATVNTSLCQGDIAIVKIGDSAVKIVLK